ncbi:hypothetical protein LguiA_029877 [Lonicera macranthoides]
MIRCSTDSPIKHYSITLLPSDGIGPKVMSVAKNVLNLTASLERIELGFKEMPMGGAALDLTGVPLPEETLSAAKQSDGVLLVAIGEIVSLSSISYSWEVMLWMYLDDRKFDGLIPLYTLINRSNLSKGVDF